MTVESWLLLVALAFLAGYMVGHRHGRVEGFRDGAVFAPIEMRREALERGRCTICGTGTRKRSEVEPGCDAEIADASRRSPADRE